MRTHVDFDRQLFQKLPLPVARAYLKAFNSHSPKEIHDNALAFGLCLSRLLGVIAIATLRDAGGLARANEAYLVGKLDRPSDGHWRDWATVALASHVRAGAQVTPLAASTHAALTQRAMPGMEDVAGATGLLMSFVSGKPVVRRSITPAEFLGVLVQYRNAVQGHGAPILDAEVNRRQGEALLVACARVAQAIPVWDEHELVFVAESAVEAGRVRCTLLALTGSDALRLPERSYPGIDAAPVQAHVILLDRGAPDRFVDLHPLVLFEAGSALLYNGARGRKVVYLDFGAGGAAQPVEGVAEDVRQLRQSLGAAAPDRAGDGAAPDGEVAPSRFRRESLLGAGGMGEVYRAFDEVLKRVVVLKRIRQELLARPGIQRRFLEEARSVARLNHPNIVSILTIDSDDVGPYLVMEHVEGGNVRQRLQQGPIPVVEACATVRQLLSALEHAHQRGVVHCDIKPENILLTAGGTPKLADFGLAMLLADTDGVHERAAGPGGYRLGTRGYRAPELERGSDPPDWRTDQFALGVTFHELLTGLPPRPFRDDRLPSLVIPVVRRLMHDNAGLRYASPAEALEDLRDLERALALADVSEEKAARQAQTVIATGMQHVRAGRFPDATASFERVLAERPSDEGAAAGLLLVDLATGQMDRVAERYGALLDRDSDHPTFVRLRRFFESIESPVVLRMTAAIAPMSYRASDLGRGRLTKELIPYDARHVNLGDVGELLVDAQRAANGSTPRMRSRSKHRYTIDFDIGEVAVTAEFTALVRSGGWFQPTALTGLGVAFTVQGDPMGIYRFVRYVAHHLTERAKRDLEAWFDHGVVDRLGMQADREIAAWRALQPDIREFASADGEGHDD
jgi:tRNA A-37 threonylcarbamoyl transferase component Bud32